ncbi:beta-eliminating lyase-related protein [Actinoplanes sp. NEAU-A12]|uniref:Beta-eliminating lyase-related protein n=1 Tax=Actinoplanes sandaracinus TaxID=3045177 RepID=A0ABT6WTZ2_9ACTN|nr:beta-eliminating lyase-related protein [Actinoplanes sandaracinus]MDI6103085.1 beta-eliminating lyase-related protein [Actinoplanes sandaracinus]
MPDDHRQRRLTAMRSCDRILSGSRPKTMRERLADVEAGGDLDEWPDFYGGGPVAALEERIAGLLGTQSAVFFPTGTMAQQVALRYGADRSGIPAAALHPLGHQEVHERHAYAELTGLRGVRSTDEPRNPTAAELAALGEPVSTVVIELPLRDAGFVLPAWTELVEITKAARAIGARVHFDGARIWESTPHLGRSLQEVAALADSVYVSFYKSLEGISGAVLAGTADLGDYARAWRHRYGGTLFQQWPAALAAMAGLDRELPRLPEYVAHARTVADALAVLPGARVFPRPPHTHQFRLWLPYPAAVLGEAVLALADRERIWFAGGWLDADVPGYARTEITVAEPALEWTAEDVIAAGALLLKEIG